MFKAQTCRQLSYKFIIGSETKFWILKQDNEMLLELLKQVLLHDLDFHIIWQLIIKVILLKEWVWAQLKVLQSITLPFKNDCSWNLLWTLFAYLYDEILYHISHMVSILTWRNFLTDHEALHFLNCQWVEEHAYKLEEENYSMLCGIMLCSFDVSESTSWQGCRHKIDGYDVLLDIVILVDTHSIHPWFVEVSVGR